MFSESEDTLDINLLELRLCEFQPRESDVLSDFVALALVCFTIDPPLEQISLIDEGFSLLQLLQSVLENRTRLLGLGVPTVPNVEHDFTEQPNELDPWS